MNLVTGVFLYLLIWWIVLFAVLGWGSTHAEKNQPGMMHGAPANPQLRRKFIATTLIAALVWLAIFGLIQSDLISFHRMVQDEPD
jgi:predicted secreted protein